MIARLCITLNLLLCCCLFGQGNVVTDWATVVQPAVNTPPRLPGIQFVLRATIQLAVYDAVMAIEGGHESFTPAIPAPAGADVRAAAATAAYVTARARVDSSQYDQKCSRMWVVYRQKLFVNGDSEPFGVVEWKHTLNRSEVDRVGTPSPVGSRALARQIGPGSPQIMRGRVQKKPARFRCHSPLNQSRSASDAVSSRYSIGGLE